MENLNQKSQVEQTACLDKYDPEKGMVKNCEYCGGVEVYTPIDGTETIYINHDKCEKNYSYKNMSVDGKTTQNNSFKNAELENDTEKRFYKYFKKYVDIFEDIKNEGMGFVMMGNSGTGKTFAANCIINALRDKNNAVFSFTLSAYLNGIKKGYANDGDLTDIETKLLRNVRNADLVVIDDIGSEKITEWAQEKVFNLFDEIYRFKVPIIITSNMNGDELSKHLNINGYSKVVDRLLERCKGLVFNWESKRKNIGQQKWNDIFKD